MYTYYISDTVLSFLGISFEIFRVSLLKQIYKVDTIINSILQICNNIEEKKLTFVGYKHTYGTSWDIGKMAQSADSWSYHLCSNTVFNLLAAL